MTNRLIVNAHQGKTLINKNIYGHFIEHLGRCVYDGIWVGEDSPIPNTRGIRKDMIKALKQINIPVLRWPGGCFADNYHWQDGVGPREKRPCTVNSFWGDVTENNHFGTHEFMDLCDQLECEPYIAANVGSGTVREMEQWVEYLTFGGNSQMADMRRKNGRGNPWKIKYWGVGNESWGFGGNMRPEYYADIYKHYQAYVRNYNAIPCHLRTIDDNDIFKISCGSKDTEYERTEVMLREAVCLMSGLSLHYYSTDAVNRGPATGFDEKQWFNTLKKAMFMDNVVSGHSAVMDKYDPERRVGLIVDEWGTWYDVEPGTNPACLYQQNTLRDALVAGIHLNIFNNRCDRVRMANIAQMVNVLQSLILTDCEKMIMTPTYHVFEMYKVHQQAKMLPVHMECSSYTCDNEVIDMLNVSASQDESGKIHISFCNLDPNNSAELICEINGFSGKNISGRVLTSDDMDAKNTFDNHTCLEPVGFDDITRHKEGMIVTLPAKSVVVLKLAED